MNYILGRFLERIRFPAMVRPFRYYDGEKGQVIEIKTSPLYTKLIVGEKEFFFIRETGKYDGFGGMSDSDANPITDCKVGEID